MIIKFHRIKQGLTQEYLAHNICSISHLSKIESGSNRGHPDTINILMQRLNIDAKKEDEYIRWIEDRIDELHQNITYYDKVTATKTFHLLIEEEEYASSTQLINKFYLIIWRYYLFTNDHKGIEKCKRLLTKLKNTFSILEDLLYGYLSGIAECLTGKTELGLQMLLDYVGNPKTNLPYLRGEDYYEVSLRYSVLNQPDYAILYAKKAMVHLQEDNNLIRLLHTQSILAINYTRSKLYLAAEQTFQMLIRNSKLLSQQDLYYQSLFNLSLLKKSLESYVEAEELMNRVLKFYKPDTHEYRNILLTIIDVKTGKGEEAKVIKELIKKANNLNLSEKQSLYLEKNRLKLFSQQEYVGFLENVLYPYIKENGNKQEINKILEEIIEFHEKQNNANEYLTFSKLLLNNK